MARHVSAETRERAACRGLRSNTHNRGEIPQKNTDECNVRILVTPRGIALQRLPIGNGEARGASVQSRAACRGLRSNTHNRGTIPQKKYRVKRPGMVTPRGIALQRLPIGDGEARGASVQSRAACRGLRSNTHNRGTIPQKNTESKDPVW